MTEIESAEQILTPLVQAGGLSVISQDDELIIYKTRFGKPLALLNGKFSKEELLETLFRNPNFRELIRKSRPSAEAVAKILSAKGDEKEKAALQRITAGEKVEFEERSELDREKLRQSRLENNRLEQEIKLRREYADKIYSLVVFWIIGLGLMTLADAVFTYSLVIGNALPKGVPITDIWLSDSVLIALWGSATATIIGLFVYVAKHIFPVAASVNSENNNKNS